MVYQREYPSSGIRRAQTDIVAQVLLKADMLDYYSVSGCYILKPWSYGIWESIQRAYAAMFIRIDTELLSRLV